MAQAAAAASPRQVQQRGITSPRPLSAPSACETSRRDVAVCSRRLVDRRTHESRSLLQMTTISVDDEGVWCQDASEPRMGIRWEEIYAVSAYRDEEGGKALATVELDFDFGEYISLHDSWPGFDAALEAINMHLAGANPNWRESIYSLQSDEDPVVLWSRQR